MIASPIDPAAEIRHAVEAYQDSNNFAALLDRLLAIAAATELDPLIAPFPAIDAPHALAAGQPHDLPRSDCRIELGHAPGGRFARPFPLPLAPRSSLP